jgi:hypothetical protein
MMMGWLSLPLEERERRVELAKVAYGLRDELPEFADRLLLMNAITAGEVENLYVFAGGSIVVLDGADISVADYLAQRQAQPAQEEA